jgi:membrane protease YdiL (CAAX protease family)
MFQAVFRLIIDSGLGAPVAWPVTLAWAAGWLVVMLIATPVADFISGVLFRQRADLGAAPRLTPDRVFAALLTALIVSGLIEETVLRGMLLRWVENQIACRWGLEAGIAGGIGAAALIGGAIRLYRGTRAALTALQLSTLLGVLYVLSGYDLWAAVLCHGVYDAVMFLWRATRGRTRASTPAG